MYSTPINNLIAALKKLPSVGQKTAERFVFHWLASGKKEVNDLKAALGDLLEKVKSCEICWNFSDASPCPICQNIKRDHATICVVAEAPDIVVIEKTGEYNGVYHVLLGSLSPLDGIGPADLKIKELLDRVKKEHFKEIIIATDFNTEGEATSLYLLKVLKGSGAKLTRVAYGIPVGGDLEYADQATIIKAFEGRREAKG